METDISLAKEDNDMTHENIVYLIASIVAMAYIFVLLVIYATNGSDYNVDETPDQSSVDLLERQCNTDHQQEREDESLGCGEKTIEGTQG